jgi:hypothetical protein
MTYISVLYIRCWFKHVFGAKSANIRKSYFRVAGRKLESWRFRLAMFRPATWKYVTIYRQYVYLKLLYVCIAGRNVDTRKYVNIFVAFSRRDLTPQHIRIILRKNIGKVHTYEWSCNFICCGKKIVTGVMT